MIRGFVAPFLILSIGASFSLQAAKDDLVGYEVDMGWYIPSTSGSELVLDLLNLASPREPLMLPYEQEEELISAVDVILGAAFDQTLVLPVADFVPEVAEQILFEFLSRTGHQAFAQGVRREQFLDLIKRRLMPATSSCEIHLSVHPAPSLYQ